jgi:acyl-CoA hydrolase
MRQTVSFFILGLMVLAGCSVPLNTVETRPIHKGDTMSLNGYVYSLPQTSFKLNIEVVRTRTIRGPYYRFAEKLLSLVDVPTRNSNSYRISNVKLESFEEADPGHAFLVKQVSGQTDLSGLLRLGGEGLIFDDRKTTSPGDPVILTDDSGEGPLFTELSMESNTAMSIDTFYKTILTDTSFIRVPVLKQQLMVKTIDEKAEEAAEFILELRYERFMMLTGNNSTPMPDYAVKRLDEIEREYLELFIGKSFDENYRYTFYVTPSGDEIFENIELLEFSERRGVVEGGYPDSEVLSLEFRKTGKTEILKDLTRAEKLPVQNNSLYYRVPDVAEVKVSLAGRALLYDRYPVCQYGEILALPIGPSQ